MSASFEVLVELDDPPVCVPDNPWAVEKSLAGAVEVGNGLEEKKSKEDCKRSLFGSVAGVGAGVDVVWIDAAGAGARVAGGGSATALKVLMGANGSDDDPAEPAATGWVNGSEKKSADGCAGGVG